MRDMKEDPPAFSSLPAPEDRDGTTRRVGVEIEFSGLHEDDVAPFLAERLGGTAKKAETDWVVEGSDLGDIQVYLDTALRKKTESSLIARGIELGRDAIPVEIVTEPLDMAGLGRLQALCDMLRDKGAKGTKAALIYGFGIHLNVAIAGRDAEGITHPLLAYALIEDWMRTAQPIDESRRVLPFTSPYPTALVRGLAALEDDSPESAMAVYLKEAPSRNYGLDMLPIFATLDEDAVADAIGDDSAVSARPAFHFRLPDCRIDEPDWALSDEWARWLLVERVAADKDLLDKLRTAWLDDHHRITLDRSHWARRAGDILAGAGLADVEEKA